MMKTVVDLTDADIALACAEFVMRKPEYRRRFVSQTVLNVDTMKHTASVAVILFDTEKAAREFAEGKAEVISGSAA